VPCGCAWFGTYLYVMYDNIASYLYVKYGNSEYDVYVLYDKFGP